MEHVLVLKGAGSLEGIKLRSSLTAKQLRRPVSHLLVAFAKAARGHGLQPEAIFATVNGSEIARDCARRGAEPCVPVDAAARFERLAGSARLVPRDLLDARRGGAPLPRRASRRRTASSTRVEATHDPRSSRRCPRTRPSRSAAATRRPRRRAPSRPHAKRCRARAPRRLWCCSRSASAAAPSSTTTSPSSSRTAAARATACPSTCASSRTATRRRRSPTN